MNSFWKTCLLILFVCERLMAQGYSTAVNAHSHNDYHRTHPFYLAHAHRFASIEVDVFLRDGELYVAHAAEEIDTALSIETLYIQPLLAQIAKNKGKVYPDGSTLQLLVDLKTAAEPTLKVLEEKLKPIRHYFDLRQNPDAVRLVISGNMPSPDRFHLFDDIFYFDGRLGVQYTAQQLARVPLVSAPFSMFTSWNGLGRIPMEEYGRVEQVVDSLHREGKKIRFWGTPDTKTCWQAFIKLKVDYINTDDPVGLSGFLDTYERNSYRAETRYLPYQPSYGSDGLAKRPRNVILLISDGAGFSQLWAAATVNGGFLNVMNMRNIGFSNTVSIDDYNTDSAAGATAMATGSKTRNRYIGVDSTGAPIRNLPDLLATKGMVSGIISNDKITGATPSAFYAHQKDRDLSDQIAYDLLLSKTSLFIAGNHPVFGANDSLLTSSLVKQGFSFYNGVDALPGVEGMSGQKVICFDEDDAKTGYRMIEPAFDKAITLLEKGKNGFFLVLEGAKIDNGGHANDLQLAIEEYLSFDKVVGKALEYADRDGETLVIVTSDHETGGLVLIDGDYETGTVLGSFATNDHTGAPVPIFAYGPSSREFTGFMKNDDIAKLIVEIFNAD